MSSHSCWDVEDLLVIMSEGELRGPALEAAREHVVGCRQCARRLDELRAVRHALASLSRFRPSRRFGLTLRARLAEEIGRSEKPAARVREWFARRRHIFVRALTPVAAGLVLGIVFAGRPTTDATEERPALQRPVLSTFGSGGVIGGLGTVRGRTFLPIVAPRSAAAGDTALTENPPIQSVRLVRYVTF
jgi:anti-sigma factor RsiW